MAKGRVLSGMRPTGRLHLGNLVGALDNWKKLQDEYECHYFIADWHALTTDYADTSEIKQNVLEITMDWLSVGINPGKSTVFLQSWVPEHAELNVLLSMITPLAWLERNPTYKEQMAELKNKDLTTYGFLGYPVLQAADIIIYKANYVPVGVDQLPHIELTREIVRRFNHLYNKEVFPAPEPLLTEVPKLPGIDGRKMSKSYNNAIYLSDPPEVVREKVFQTVTDTHRVRRTDKGNPELSTVFAYHRVFSPPQDVEYVDRGCRTAGIGCVDCKALLARNLLKVMEPIYNRRTELAKRPDHVMEILREGSRKASAIARQTLQEAKEAMKIDI